jgi:transmembrane sensor
MSVETAKGGSDQEPTSAQFAEAAAWVARLHGPNRNARVERGLRRWLSASPSHAAAFEAVTAGWEIAGRLAKEPLPSQSRWRRAGYRDGFIRSAVAVAAIAALAVGATLYALRLEGMVTGIGEQRTLTLEDGTRITLNTDTRVTVDYDARARTVELKRGEALFEVAKRANWPFIVKVGDRQVRALGTSFVVRHDTRALAVTLVEGSVAVAPLDVPDSEVSAVRPPAIAGESAGQADGQPRSGRIDTIAYLAPGQRLTFGADTPPKLDLPEVEKITAWRRGLADFERTPLADVVAEMNRYSVVKLVVEDPRAAAIPITGVFRTGDVSSLAAAVARAYHLQVMQSDESIRLLGVPHAL